jgi:DNA-directed RNA polymerase I, II, and III subunit RPABC2
MEELRFESRILHPEVQAIQRQQIVDALKEPRITEPYYTKYEYACLVGTRADQLSRSARPLISMDGIVTSDPQFVWIVAEQEVAEGVLPFIIHRRLPSGVSEYWSALELKIRW